MDTDRGLLPNCSFHSSSLGLTPCRESGLEETVANVVWSKSPFRLTQDPTPHILTLSQNNSFGPNYTYRFISYLYKLTFSSMFKMVK